MLNCRASTLPCMLGMALAVPCVGQVIESISPTFLPTSSTRVESTFGNRIDINDSWMAIGADHDVPHIPGHGEVYLYERGDTSWEFRQRIMAPDGFEENHFGLPVLLGDGILFVGAPTDDDLGYWSGSVYVWTLQGGTWVFQNKITPQGQSNVYALFGLTMCFGIDQDELIVGAYLESTDNNTSGAVYVFERTGNTWTMRQRLAYPDTPGAAYFGRSVAVQDRKLAVGVPGLRTDHFIQPHGGVAIYNRVGSQWILEQTVLPDIPQEFQLFGEWVDLHGNLMVVSSPSQDVDAQRRGVAHIFEIDGNELTLQAQLTPPLANTTSFSFPSTFSDDGRLLFVGGHSSDHHATDAGSGWIFQRSESGVWDKPVQLSPMSYASGDSFGRSMAFNGNAAYVSAPRSDIAGTDAGAIFTFELEDCDGSGYLDAWELFEGILADGNLDGIPDNCQQMPWDLNGDGLVNGGDMGIFYSHWGSDGSNGGDFDASGLVDSGDLAFLLIHWSD